MIDSAQRQALLLSYIVAHAVIPRTQHIRADGRWLDGADITNVGRYEVGRYVYMCAISAADRNNPAAVICSDQDMTA